jgi:hypothetical protein
VVVVVEDCLPGCVRVWRVVVAWIVCSKEGQSLEMSKGEGRRLGEIRKSLTYEGNSIRWRGVLQRLLKELDTTCLGQGAKLLRVRRVD